MLSVAEGPVSDFCVELSSETDNARCRIREMEITGGFLDAANFSLSPMLNCIIGARGAGKTSSVELIRYALDAFPTYDPNGIERKKIESLVAKNFIGGRVVLRISTNDGLDYIISRAANEQPMVLLPDGTPTSLSVKSLSSFRVSIYSQNQIEAIAERTDAQLELIDNLETDQLNELTQRVSALRSELRTNASKIIPQEDNLAGHLSELAALPAVNDKLGQLALSLGDDVNAINHAHKMKALRDRENLMLADSLRTFNGFGIAIENLQSRFSGDTRSIDGRDFVESPNKALIASCEGKIQRAAGNIGQQLESIIAMVTEIMADIEQVKSVLSLVHKEQELHFQTLLEKDKLAQGKSAERTSLEKLRNQLESKQRGAANIEKDLAALNAARSTMKAELTYLEDSRFAIRHEIVDRINRDLNPMIRVSLIQQGNWSAYRRFLENSLKGSKLKQNLVAEKIASNIDRDTLSQLIQSRDTKALTERSELNFDQACKVIEVLSSPVLLFELELIEIGDQPRIELKDGEKYKDSRQLSTGQKCTSILPILLLDNDYPLIIDQPEDNLDNRFVYETIVEIVRKTKHTRQLIFITHNPNIPVLADAEHMVVLESDGEVSRKIAEGSVDECKANIVMLLEGGETAFKARKNRYLY
ncbi:MAG: AAA family ATPase [Pirellulaceae bacterium]|nr:AAA family ATPase [Pirellulaceae bacterium]